MPECRGIAKIFQSRGGFVELSYFDKHFFKNKKAPQGNILEFFLVDTFKTTFWVENVTQRWTPTGPFFPKSGCFFFFSKTSRGGLPSPQTVHLWMWQNMHQYPWMSLNILENAWINCSDYARTLTMLDHVSCSTGFWRCLGFKMCQSSEYGTVVYVRVTQISECHWIWFSRRQ